ncbi:MAG: hypothetical protein K0R66_77 [Gammaproteobacteria bacterium]|nr:hypothetical protein [Gammaproteobacteria bacterium]
MNLAKAPKPSRDHYTKVIARYFKEAWGAYDSLSLEQQELKVKLSCEAKEQGLPFRLILIDEDKLTDGHPEFVGTVSADKRSSISPENIDPLPSISNDSDFGPWLRGLYINQEYRGKHLSLSLIYVMLIKLQELGFTQQLYVWHYEPSLSAFYQKLGFNELGKAPSKAPEFDRSIAPKVESGKLMEICAAVQAKLSQKALAENAFILGPGMSAAASSGTAALHL